MPEAVKEGGGSSDVAAPEDAVPPPVDLATDGAVEVKPPPATEPSLPVDQVQQQEGASNKEEEVGETAPEVSEPPTEQSGSDKASPQPQTAEVVNVNKGSESNPKEELDEMITKGRGLLTIKLDCFAASEVLSKACEKASEIYGELSDHCAELYYWYGCSMLECGKSENTVLGENMKDKDKEEADEDEDDEVEDEDEDKENNEKNEAMEIEETEEESSTAVGTSNGAVKESNDGAEDVNKTDDEEDDDSSLKVAWEMFELAKVAFTRLDDQEKLANTFLKLAEVGIESGHPSAMEDMLQALDIRQKLFPNKRIIPETHFNIGLAYSVFQMFDEAITHFEKSKSLLEDMATSFQNLGDEQSLKEAKEIQDILPELKDKIQEMVDSKREKREEVEKALKNGMSSALENGAFSAATSSVSDKPASNITHLIKRKRKIDEVTSDLPNKAVEEPKRKVKAIEKEVEAESLADGRNTLVSSKNSLESKESITNIEIMNKEEAMETEEVAITDNKVEVTNLETLEAKEGTTNEKDEQSVNADQNTLKLEPDQLHPESTNTDKQVSDLTNESEKLDTHITKQEDSLVTDGPASQLENTSNNEEQKTEKLEKVKLTSDKEDIETVTLTESSTVTPMDEDNQEAITETKTDEPSSDKDKEQNAGELITAESSEVKDSKQSSEHTKVPNDTNGESLNSNMSSVEETNMAQEVSENKSDKLKNSSEVEPAELKNHSTRIETIAKGTSEELTEASVEHSVMETSTPEVVETNDKTESVKIENTMPDEKEATETNEGTIENKVTKEPAESEAAMEIVQAESDSSHKLEDNTHDTDKQGSTDVIEMETNVKLSTSQSEVDKEDTETSKAIDKKESAEIVDTKESVDASPEKSVEIENNKPAINVEAKEDALNTLNETSDQPKVEKITELGNNETVNKSVNLTSESSVECSTKHHEGKEEEEEKEKPETKVESSELSIDNKQNIKEKSNEPVATSKNSEVNSVNCPEVSTEKKVTNGCQEEDKVEESVRGKDKKNTDKEELEKVNAE